MGKYRFSVKVLCQYYDGERKQEMFCLGFSEGHRIHQGFAHPGLMEQWKEHYCQKEHENCPIAKILREHRKE